MTDYSRTTLAPIFTFIDAARQALADAGLPDYRQPSGAGRYELPMLEEQLRDAEAAIEAALAAVRDLRKKEKRRSPT